LCAVRATPASVIYTRSLHDALPILGDVTIQLMNRHWDIFDSVGDFKQVEGEGVVGEQPILASGAVYQYVSGCNLKSEMGYMEGHYEMTKIVDGSVFHVEIPRFNLIASFKLN